MIKRTFSLFFAACALFVAALPVQAQDYQAVRDRLQSLTGPDTDIAIAESAIPGVLQVVERLDQAGMLNCLQLLHCHMGSQISDIQVINTGLQDVARVYADLRARPGDTVTIGGE